MPERGGAGGEVLRELRDEARLALRGYAACLVLVALGTGAIHGPRVARNFHRHHWEDFRFFRHSRTQIEGPLDCFTRPSIWPGLYRPLSTNCYYLLGRQFFGNQVEGYHVVSVVFFLANALLLFSLARVLLPHTWALIAPALFASRMAHVQLLLYTSEMQGLLSAFFSLVALRLWMAARARPSSWREGSAAGAFVLALLSKESAVVLPALVSIHAWLFDRGALRRSLGWWLIGGGWAVLFATVFRGVSGHEPTGFAYDFSTAIVARYASYFLAFLNLMVYPRDNLEMVSRVPALAGTAAGLLSLTALLAVMAAALLASPWLGHDPRARALRVLGFGLAWFVAGAAPYVIFADRLFMRYSYFGHAGLSLALAAAARLLALSLRPWRPPTDVRPEAAVAAAAAPSGGPARP